jgi:hypothetical protein
MAEKKVWAQRQKPAIRDREAGVAIRIEQSAAVLVVLGPCCTDRIANA